MTKYSNAAWIFRTHYHNALITKNIFIHTWFITLEANSNIIQTLTKLFRHLFLIILKGIPGIPGIPRDFFGTKQFVMAINDTRLNYLNAIKIKIGQH